MKSKILWVAIATLATTACSKTESVNDTDVKQLIGFSAPAIGKQTKALISGTVYPTDVPFGMFSYVLTGNKEWSNDKNDATVMMDNVEISYDHPVWKASDGEPYYWPTDAGSSLTFIAYSPKSITGLSYDLNNNDGLTVTDYVNDGSTDLMYSSEIANQKYTTASGVVSLQFSHAMTQVYFVAKTASNYEPDAVVTIKSIKFNNIINKGTFKANPAGTAAWTLDQSVADYMVYEDAGGQVVKNAETTVGTALVMIPQADLASTTQRVTVVYEVSGSGIPEATITKELVLTGEWARNAKIKYLLTITLTEIIYSPTISDWNPEGDGTMS